MEPTRSRWWALFGALLPLLVVLCFAEDGTPADPVANAALHAQIAHTTSTVTRVVRAAVRLRPLGHGITPARDPRVGVDPPEFSPSVTTLPALTLIRHASRLARERARIAPQAHETTRRDLAQRRPEARAPPRSRTSNV